MPSCAQRRPTAPNVKLLLKTKESKDFIFRIIRPESRGPQGALWGLIKKLRSLHFSLESNFPYLNSIFLYCNYVWKIELQLIAFQPGVNMY